MTKQIIGKGIVIEGVRRTEAQKPLGALRHKTHLRRKLF